MMTKAVLTGQEDPSASLTDPLIFRSALKEESSSKAVGMPLSFLRTPLKERRPSGEATTYFVLSPP